MFSAAAESFSVGDLSLGVWRDDGMGETLNKISLLSPPPHLLISGALPMLLLLLPVQHPQSMCVTFRAKEGGRAQKQRQVQVNV